MNSKNILSEFSSMNIDVSGTTSLAVDFDAKIVAAETEEAFGLVPEQVLKNVAELCSAKDQWWSVPRVDVRSLVKKCKMKLLMFVIFCQTLRITWREIWRAGSAVSSVGQYIYLKTPCLVWRSCPIWQTVRSTSCSSLLIALQSVNKTGLRCTCYRKMFSLPCAKYCHVCVWFAGLAHVLCV